MSQSSHIRKGPDHSGNGANSGGGGYDDRRYYSVPGAGSMAFQSFGGGQMGYHEVQQQHSHSSAAHAIIEDHEIMGRGGSSRIRMDFMSDGAQGSASIGGSLSGSQSQPLSSNNSHLELHSANPTSLPPHYSNPISTGCVSNSGLAQLQNQPNPRKQIHSSIYQGQVQNSIQAPSNSRIQGVPPSSSPSPSPPSSPTIHACQYNGYPPHRNSHSQPSHSSPSLSPRNSQTSGHPHLSQPAQPFVQQPQQSHANPPSQVRNYNIPVEKIVWDYLHLLHGQNKRALGYLTPYTDDSFNIGKFHCMVTEFCKRQKISKDALIIHSKNWFKEYIEQNELENVELSLEDEIKKYVMSKIKRYENLGFRLESEKISAYYCKLIPLMIKSLWRRLEDASFQRVDWVSKQFLGSDVVDPKVCNYEMVSHVMKLNNTPSEKDHPEAIGGRTARPQDFDLDLTSKEKSDGSIVDSLVDHMELDIGSTNHREILTRTDFMKDDIPYDHNIDIAGTGMDNTGTSIDNIIDQNNLSYGHEDNYDQDRGGKGLDEDDEQTKEMVIVSRTQKWLLRNVKVEDFKHLIWMDQLREKSFPGRSKLPRTRQSKLAIPIRLPRKTQNSIIDYINLCNYKA